MATFNLRLPDGTILENIPEGTSPQDIATRFNLPMPGAEQAPAAAPKKKLEWVGNRLVDVMASPEEQARQAVPAAPMQPGQQGSMQPSVGSQVATELVGGGFGLPTAMMATGFAPLVGQPSALDLIQDPNRVAEARAQINAQSQLPPMSKERALGVGIAGALDPVNLAIPGGGIVNKLLTGGVASIAGDIGAEKGGFWGGLFSGVAAGAGTNLAMNTIPKLFNTVVDSVKGAPEVARSVATVAGSAKAGAAAQSALDANPDLAANLSRAREIQKITNVDLPVQAASGGDTTIDALAKGQMASADNTAFTAALKNQQTAAEKAVQEGINASTLSPQVLKQKLFEKGQLAAAASKQVEELNAQTAGKRKTGLENITARISDYTQQYQSGLLTKEDIGTRLTNLIDAKESAILNKLSPEYTDLLDTASASGLKLTTENAIPFREFATDSMNAAVFSKFPTLYGQIKTQLNPAKLAKEGGLSISNVDSLKRATNKAIRDSKDADQIRVLGALKNELDTAIQTIDPDFATAYKAIDAKYATELGLPFSEKGIIDINRARFVEQTVPKLTENASGLKQALAIIGNDPKGMEIVEDAFLHAIGNNKSIINTATGEINPAQLKRWVNSNEALKLAPGLKERLLKDASSIEVLQNNRIRIYEAEKAAKQVRAESLYEQAYNTKEGINGFVGKRISNAAEFEDLWNNVKGDVLAREGVKMAMLDNVMSKPGDKLQFFRDNQAAFETAFGKGYLPKLEALFDASQRLKDFPVVPRLNVGTARKTGFERATGSGLTQIASEARNPIMGTFRQMGNILSRFTQNQTTKIENQEIQRFLLDRDAIDKTVDVIGELEKNGLRGKAMGLAKELTKNTAFNLSFGGLVGAKQGLTAQPKEVIQDEFSEGIEF